MFSRQFLNHDNGEIEHEMARRCAILRLDCNDTGQLRWFIHDLLQNLELLKIAAATGDVLARTKLELYGLAMLMHKSQREELGEDYLRNFAMLARENKTWAIFAHLLWHELESRHAK